MHIPLSQAHKYLYNISRSKTYADEAAGVLTATKDPSRGNKKFVDLVELERVYGKVKNPDATETNETDSNGQHNLLLQSYENRIQDLQKQLDLAGERETALIDERKQLIDLLSTEKEEKRALMPPPLTYSKRNRTEKRTGGRG